MTTELQLAREVESVSAARRAAISWVAGRRGIEEAPAEAIALVVSELVTNVVVNGTEPITLRLEQRSDTVHIEVDDGDSEPLHDRPPASDAGLLVVQRISDRCGTRATAHGAAKWAEVLIVEPRAAEQTTASRAPT